MLRLPHLLVFGVAWALQLFLCFQTATCTRQLQATPVLTFKIGLVTGRMQGSHCGEHDVQKLLGYNQFITTLARQPASSSSFTDRTSRQYQIAFQLTVREASNCSSSEVATAMSDLLYQDRVHFVVEGTDVWIADQVAQAAAAERLMYLSCSTDQTLFQQDYATVFGLALPLTHYTQHVLAAYASAGAMKRIGLVYRPDLPQYRTIAQAIFTDIKQQIKIHSDMQLALNHSMLYFSDQSLQAAYYARSLVFTIMDANLDVLLVADGLDGAVGIAKALAAFGKMPKSIWIASEDMDGYIQGVGTKLVEHHTATVQWHPNLRYADSIFGTASQYAEDVHNLHGIKPSSQMAAASTTMLTLMSAIQQGLQDCDLLDAKDDSDQIMFNQSAITCYNPGSYTPTNTSGQTAVLNALKALDADTMFGPVQFSAMRQNIGRLPAVVMVHGGTPKVILPAEAAEDDLGLEHAWIGSHISKHVSWIATDTGRAAMVVSGSLILMLVVVGVYVYYRETILGLFGLVHAVSIRYTDLDVDVPPRLAETQQHGYGTTRGRAVRFIILAPEHHHHQEASWTQVPQSTLGSIIFSLGPRMPTDIVGTGPSAGSGFKKAPKMDLLSSFHAPEHPIVQQHRRANVWSWAKGSRSRKAWAALAWRAMSLHHPALCAVLGIVWDWPGIPWPVLVQESCELGSLAELMDNQTVALNTSKKANIVTQLAHAMKYLHAQEPPIVMQGLSLAHVLLDSAMHPHLVVPLASMQVAPVKRSNVGHKQVVPDDDGQGLLEAMEQDVHDFALLVCQVYTRQAMTRAEVNQSRSCRHTGAMSVRSPNFNSSDHGDHRGTETADSDQPASAWGSQASGRPATLWHPNAVPRAPSIRWQGTLKSALQSPQALSRCSSSAGNSDDEAAVPAMHDYSRVLPGSADELTAEALASLQSKSVTSKRRVSINLGASTQAHKAFVQNLSAAIGENSEDHNDHEDFNLLSMPNSSFPTSAATLRPWLPSISALASLPGSSANSQSRQHVDHNQLSTHSAAAHDAQSHWPLGPGSSPSIQDTPTATMSNMSFSRSTSKDQASTGQQMLNPDPGSGSMEPSTPHSMHSTTNNMQVTPHHISHSPDPKRQPEDNSVYEPAKHSTSAAQYRSGMSSVANAHDSIPGQIRSISQLDDHTTDHLDAQSPNDTVSRYHTGSQSPDPPATDSRHGQSDPNHRLSITSIAASVEQSIPPSSVHTPDPAITSRESRPFSKNAAKRRASFGAHALVHSIHIDELHTHRPASASAKPRRSSMAGNKLTQTEAATEKADGHTDDDDIITPLAPSLAHNNDSLDSNPARRHATFSGLASAFTAGLQQQLAAVPPPSPPAESRLNSSSTVAFAVDPSSSSELFPLDAQDMGANSQMVASLGLQSKASSRRTSEVPIMELNLPDALGIRTSNESGISLMNTTRNDVPHTARSIFPALATVNESQGRVQLLIKEIEDFSPALAGLLERCLGLQLNQPVPSFADVCNELQNALDGIHKRLTTMGGANLVRQVSIDVRNTSSTCYSIRRASTLARGAGARQLSNQTSRHSHMSHMSMASRMQSFMNIPTADDLIYELFPPKVAEALQAGKPVQPERHECVSIFFSDIQGYTDMCAQMAPHEVMDLLNRLYTQFDSITKEMGLFKVETIGDAYMAVSNLRWPQPKSHAQILAAFALRIISVANTVAVHTEQPELGNVSIRVGLHCGPVVASVVGTLNRRYCLFGDTVNTASRMESNSEANRVHCSRDFAQLLQQQCPEARVVPRGAIAIKGKGNMETAWVEHVPWP